MKIVVDDTTVVSGRLAMPPAATACLVLAHGAGAGMTHPFLAAVAAGLADRRIATLRYQFPSMERGAKRPDRPPLEQGERITTIMPLPEDEDSWAGLDVMFATTGGTVRRNKLSDFTQVNRAGKIAMKLDDSEEIVDVQTCNEQSDVLLTTQNGQCIRFCATDVRVFKGRDSMGVRGIALGKDDRVIAMSILRHMEADAGERLAYLKMRRAVAGEEAASASGNGDALPEAE